MYIFITHKNAHTIHNTKYMFTTVTMNNKFVIKSKARTTSYDCN